jgi:hypothetical protein
MVSFNTQIPWRWVPPLNLDGLLHRAEISEIVRRLCDSTLHWRWASASDWPHNLRIAGDFRFARSGGFGFIVEIASERFFLVPRGWEEPEWGLASYDFRLGHWRDLGDLEPTPEHWTFPTVEERSEAE